MKRIFALLAMALIAAAPATQAVARPVAAEAVMGVKIGAVLSAVIDADQDHWRRRDDDDRKDNRDDRDDGRWNNGGRDRGGEERRDNRINRAMQIASSRGRVLDAGQQSGSIFWVRVATERGRVDLLVDTDSGRIVGER